MNKYCILFLFVLMLSACKKDDTGPENTDDVPPLVPVAVYSLTDLSGNCFNAGIQGYYALGLALNTTNKVVLKVNVTTAGSYAVSTVTVNGYRFAGSGIFTTTGAQNITLIGVGIPASVNNDNFVVTNGTSTCSFSVAINDPSSTDNDHLYFGNPSNAEPKADSVNNYFMRKSYYTLSYSRDRGTPNWVSWHLYSNDIGNVTRQDDFRPDNTLPSGWFQVQENSYSQSGFDRGHNVPSGDRTNAVAANSSTFLMTNMIPQAPYHNQVVWSIMEDSLRQLVGQGYELYITMGSYGTGGTGSSGYTTTINGGSITVPSNIYKIAVIIPDGSSDSSRVNTGTRVIAVDIPNNNTLNSNWKNYRVSVDAIETATGLDFLKRLPPSLQSVIEAQVDNL